MIIKFWGVRGSIPTPSPPGDIRRRLKAALVEAQRVKPAPEDLDSFVEGLPAQINSVVGGNTPCLEVLHEGARLIIDAGSGLAPLGLELGLRNLADRLAIPLDPQTLSPPPEIPAKPMVYDFLLTHTHWDHIQGFPFFRPAYQPENTINVYGADAARIEATLVHQQSDVQLFPIPLRQAGAKIAFLDFPLETSLNIGPFEVSALPLPHPGGSLAFKIAAGGATMVFATDYELREGDPESDRARVLLGEFAREADVLISDTQYTYLENLSKEGWGHSNPLQVVEMALACRVKRFYLFHHDPCYSDVKLYDILDMTVAYTNLLHPGNELDIQLAVEGREIRV